MTEIIVLSEERPREGVEATLGEYCFTLVSSVDLRRAMPDADGIISEYRNGRLTHLGVYNAGYGSDVKVDQQGMRTAYLIETIPSQLTARVNEIVDTDACQRMYRWRDTSDWQVRTSGSPRIH